MGLLPESIGGSPRALYPGMIIASPRTPKIPFGFLQRVQRVSRTASGVIVVSRPIPLGFALRAQVPFDLQPIHPFTKCTLLTKQLFSAGPHTGSQVTGKICFGIAYRLRGTMSLRHLAASLTVTISEHASAQFTTYGSVSFRRAYTLLATNLPTFTFWVGGVPLVVTPRLTLEAGALGSAAASLNLGTDEHATFTLGATCHDTACSPIATATATYIKPYATPEAQASFTGFFGPHLELLLYGLAGPNVGYEDYIEADANIKSNPWWRLYAGDRATTQFRFRALWKDVSSQQFVHPFQRKELLNAGGPLTSARPTRTPTPVSTATATPEPTSTPTSAPPTAPVPAATLSYVHEYLISRPSESWEHSFRHLAHTAVMAKDCSLTTCCRVP